MSVEAKVYESHYDYKMDPKYRVSVPVSFRPDGEETIRLQISNLHEVPVIKVFTSAAFEDKFRRVRESNLTQSRKDEIEGSLRMLSKEVSINPQGKLTVPKDWAEDVGLQADGPVKLAGRGGYYMLCTEENFKRIAKAEISMDDGGIGVL